MIETLIFWTLLKLLQSIVGAGGGLLVAVGLLGFGLDPSPGGGRALLKGMGVGAALMVIGICIYEM